MSNILIKQTENFLNENYLLPILSNLSSLYYNYLPDISWAGFYLVQDNQLILGPFQGKPACTIIQFNKGVCGTSYQTKKSQLVPNVHLFPGHIACDSASNSELVIPLIYKDRCIGLLDLDSTSLNRFTIDDQLILEECCQLISNKIGSLL